MVKSEQIIYLTSVEYAILMAAKGIKHHYTLQAGEKKIGEEEICLAMTHLYTTGLIDSDSEKFFIREDLERLLRAIRDAKYILCVRFGKREELDFCCFVSEYAYTGMKISRTDENSYEIYELDAEGIQEALATGVDRTQTYEAVIEEEASYLEIRNSRQSISRETVRKYHNLCLVVERILPEYGNVEKRLLVHISEQGLHCDETWRDAVGGVQRTYDECYIRAIVDELMKGEET